MNGLSLQQAKMLRDYLKNSSGQEMSNVELLAGLAVCFCGMYFELIIDDMEKKGSK